MQNCPCGTGKTYADCCGPFLSQQKNPSTPEELMRSRFTAYSSADDAYIAATMKAPASNRSDPATVRERMDKITWTRLEVLHASQQGKKGSVEFRAYYVSDDQQNVLHEISEFRQDDGKWFYIDGTQREPGRNELCACGSGKKFKKCCG